MGLRLWVLAAPKWAISLADSPHPPFIEISCDMLIHISLLFLDWQSELGCQVKNRSGFGNPGWVPRQDDMSARVAFPHGLTMEQPRQVILQGLTLSTPPSWMQIWSFTPGQATERRYNVPLFRAGTQPGDHATMLHTLHCMPSLLQLGSRNLKFCVCDFRRRIQVESLG